MTIAKVKRLKVKIQFSSKNFECLMSAELFRRKAITALAQKLDSFNSEVK